MNDTKKQQNEQQNKIMKASKWLSKKSEKYLAEAKELLKNYGDLVQASEKFWGAAALTVKMFF